MRTLLLERSDPLSHGAYAFHLWSSASQRMLLSAWSPTYLASVPSALNCLLTRTLPRLAADAAPLPGGILRNCSCGEGGEGGDGQGGSGGQGGGRGGGGRGGFDEIQPEGAWLLQPAWGAAGGSSGGGSGGAATAAVAAAGEEGAAAGGAAGVEVDADAGLVVDSSGRCRHGWVYGGGCGGAASAVGGAVALHAVPARAAQRGAGACWSTEPGLGGHATLTYSAPLEAFVPLPPALLAAGSGGGGGGGGYFFGGGGGGSGSAGAGFAVSWWGLVHSLLPGCGGGGPFWTLAFADGTLSAAAESYGDHPSARTSPLPLLPTPYPAPTPSLTPTPTPTPN